MKKLVKNIVVILAASSFFACSQKAQNKKFEGGPLEFKPSTTDTKLGREQIMAKSASDLLMLPAGGYYLSTSEEILEFAETLLDLATLEQDSSRKQQLVDFSEKVREAYYSNKNNYTSFNHESSTYLELALGLSYEGTNGLQSLIYGKMDEQQSVLSRALEKITFDLKPQLIVAPRIAPSLAVTISEYEKFLRSLPEQLNSSKVDAKIVTSVRNTLQKDYLPLLSAAKLLFNTLSVGNAPATNISILEASLKGFTVLPASFSEPIVSKLAPVKKLSTKVAKPKNADELFDLLFDLWNDPLIKREKIKDGSAALYDFLNSMTPEQMSWLKTYNLDIINKRISLQNADWKARAAAWYMENMTFNVDKVSRAYGNKTSDPYVLTFKLWYAKKEIDKVGVPKIIRDIERGINAALLTEFDAGLRASSKLMAKTVTEVIAKSAGDKFLEYKNNLRDILRKEGRQELGKRIFSHKSSFVAIEDSRAALKMNKQNKFETETNPNVFSGKLPPGAVVSNAKTLGLALSLQSKRLQNAEEQSVSKKSAEYYEEVFTPVNKMMAIAGFKYMESERPRFVGMFRLVNGAADSHDMDIFNYDLERSFFAIPEKLIVSKDFTLAKNTTRELGLLATVGGNAEVARGAANMMYYFRDWTQNGFDLGFGTEEFQNVKIFPKEAFYALSMGVGSVPLRNLTREGLVGYTLNRVKKEAASFGAPADFSTESCPKPDDKDPVTLAALINVSPGGRGDIVKSADVARFILAADTFIDSVQGAGESKAAALQKVENGIKSTQKAIRCGEKSLRTLMMGLANFLSAKMQLADGGFASTYSLEQNAIVPDMSLGMKVENQLVNRRLEDQLLVIQALRKVYDRWQGQAYANIAADSYHFMNKSLFNSKLGFYKLSEKATELDKADIRLMSMTIETLKQLYPIVPLEDRDQLEFLTRVWSEKLQEFAAIVTKQ